MRVLYKLASGLQLPAWELLKLADERHAETHRAQADEPLEIRNAREGARQ